MPEKNYITMKYIGSRGGLHPIFISIFMYPIMLLFSVVICGFVEFIYIKMFLVVVLSIFWTFISKLPNYFMIILPGTMLYLFLFFIFCCSCAWFIIMSLFRIVLNLE